MFCSCYCWKKKRRRRILSFVNSNDIQSPGWIKVHLFQMQSRKKKNDNNNGWASKPPCRMSPDGNIRYISKFSLGVCLFVCLCVLYLKSVFRMAHNIRHKRRRYHFSSGSPFTNFSIYGFLSFWKEGHYDTVIQGLFPRN